MILSLNGIVVALFETFNLFALCAAALFAVLGIFKITGSFFKINVFRIRRGEVFFAAFCTAAIAAFALEATVFNFPHYAKFFTEPGFYTMGRSPNDSTVALTSDGTEAKLQYAERGGAVVPRDVTFENVNRKITSVLINAEFNDNESASAFVEWVDEHGSRGVEVQIYKRLPHENHVILQSCGQVSWLRVLVMPRKGSGSPVALLSVAVNEPIPFYFSGLRLLVFSFLIFAVIVIARKDARARASYYLFDYKFDASSKTQGFIYAAVTLLLILFSWICIYTSTVAAFAYHKTLLIIVTVAIAAASVIWRFCVKRYMPSATFAFALLSFAALFFASGLTVFLRHPPLNLVTAVELPDFSNPIAVVIRLFSSAMSYLFLPVRHSLFFPFLRPYPLNEQIILGVLAPREATGGIINFPVVFCLFYLFWHIAGKRGVTGNGSRLPILKRSLISLITAVVIILALSLLYGVSGRFMICFSVFIIVPSLFCAYYWGNDNSSGYKYKTRMTVLYALLSAAILAGLFLSASPWTNSYNDPALFRYLEYSLGILRNY